MSKAAKIESTPEAWESGALGQDENYVQAVDLNEEEINKSLELQLISIRLQKSLIEDFKNIAAIHGLGYQPLMRQVLNRFAESEKKRILKERSCELERENSSQPENELDEKHANCG
jgi:uncharacterized protein (DUF4415 family)